MTELVRICDLAGRVRGSGFVADDRGTVITSHEAVDGLARVVLHGPGERTWLAEAGDVTPLPWLALALVRTDGLGLRPLPIGARSVITPGTYVRIPARGWRQARVLAAARRSPTPRPTGSTSCPPRSSWRSARPAGTPWSWAGKPAGAGARRRNRSGARGGGHRSARRAPLRRLRDPPARGGRGRPRRSAGRPAGTERRHRARTRRRPEPGRRAGADRDHPAPGAHRRRAGTRRATRDRRRTGRLHHLGPVRPRAGRRPRHRPDHGTGRPDRAPRPRARPAPTLWLRGADLRAGDSSLADAVGRALAAARRIVSAGAEARTEAEADVGTDVGTARVASPEPAAMVGAEAAVSAGSVPGLGSAGGFGSAAPLAPLAPLASVGPSPRSPTQVAAAGRTAWAPSHRSRDSPAPPVLPARP